MTREERIKEIEKLYQYEVQKDSAVHFLLSEVKRLEAETYKLNSEKIGLTNALNRNHKIAEELKKENAELEEEGRFLLKHLSARNDWLEAIQPKLDKAVKALKRIRDEYRNECSEIAFAALAELKEEK